MKIIILFPHKFPSIGAASKRVENYLKGLRYQGVETDVVALEPISSSVFFLFLTPFTTLVKLLSSKPKADIFFIYGFGWVSKLLLLLYAKATQKKVVFEVNEKPYSIRSSGRRDVLLKYFVPINSFFLTRTVFPFADGFVVISESLKEYVLKYASKKARIIKIPILVDFDYYAGFVKKNSNFSKPYMIHTATLNDVKDGIINVFKAFALVHKNYNNHLHFYLSNRIGLKPIINEIDRIIHENTLSDYVHFLDRPDNETLINYQANAALTVINKVDTEQNRHNFATKTGEYLALGIPIITTKIGEVTHFLQHESSCLFVEPNSVEEIADAINYLINNQIKLKQIGQNGKKVAHENFEMKNQTMRLKTYFESMVS